MKITGKYRVVIINIMIALAISFIVNFSQIVSVWLSSGQPPSGEQALRVVVQPTNFLLLQFAYFFVLSFILLTVCTMNIKGEDDSVKFLKRAILCTGITVVFYFLSPRFTREGNIVLTIHAPRLFNPILVLKCSLSLLVALLYGKIFELVYQKNRIIIENEKLKNENLQATYNSLVSQINPHFLFNSFNSLSMLVRENQGEKALTYIDQLSDTFRYIIQNSQTGLVTLEEELIFLDSYKYLHEIRYEGKINFVVRVDNKYYDWLLPSFSLQPLIENAVKHNTITKKIPLSVTIETADGSLTVSNPVIPKIEEAGTGIGLKNLMGRYLLLTGRQIKVSDDGKNFSVTIPLIRPA